ncbi:hypothetical protein HII31_12854 [Pseudocercospora fuligena]|uniref:BTB domain-containing protein n=1 Tax=Pseudocercospora fuligena TaxID=685502 RepID=A0A8H6R8G8_9PEZI|nr:hypothetical protein HII31_12854 [Pseudocercospora fuligena]
MKAAWHSPSKAPHFWLQLHLRNKHLSPRKAPFKMVAVETPPSHVLEELWDNGDWTDLQIATPTKTFNVHKNIVCTVCPFFKAACARDWKVRHPASRLYTEAANLLQEGRTGVISLPENETVVYCLLRYMYGMHCDVCDEYGLSYDEEIMCIFEARTAADKVSHGSFLRLPTQLMRSKTPAAEVLEKYVIPTLHSSRLTDACSDRLFTSGDWSDLKIASPTKTFDVHKSIVCSACPFFEAACKNSWQEAQSGIIDVPEPEIIVNALIRYMYGMHNVSGIYDEQPSYTDDIKCVYQLGVAADKKLETSGTDPMTSMYEKAQWTDLKIITSTKTFNVHKSVVCATSDYFATACQLAQKAGKITTIKVPEDEIVIDAILQHCYGISEALYHDCQCETITETCELKRMEILVAADKYQLPALKEAIQQELRLQMYETGEWSDFKIYTSTRTFNVHKSVLSAASPFFKAASQNDWREAQDGGISLPENEQVVDAILQHCYGIFDVTKAIPANYSESVGKTIAFLEMIIAADKYQLPVLKEELVGASRDVINDHMSGTCVDLAKWAYEAERRFVLGTRVMQELVRNIVYETQGVLSGASDQWDGLAECPELLKDVVRLLAQSSDITDKGDDWEEPDYLKEKEPDKEDWEK